MENYYTILGVSSKATQEEIKKAYKQQARKWHPDRNKDAKAEATFKKVQEAYEILSNTAQRKKFDNAQTGWQRYTFDDQGRSKQDIDLDSFFRNYGTGPSHRYKRPVKKKYRVTISLEQAYTGTVVDSHGKKTRIPQGVRTGNKLVTGRCIYRSYCIRAQKI